MQILFLVITVLLLAVLLSGYTYFVAFYSPKHRRSSIDDPVEGEQYIPFSEYIYRISHIMENIPFESVSITAYDGCKLFGRYYHMSDDAPTEILFHGYRSCAFRDCSGGHALSRKMGFNSLVVDQRAQGFSGGNTICFGIKERRDCLSWIQYLNNRQNSDNPIILSGLSMGAATVLMAAGLPLPKNVACIVADSPYSAPSDIIEKVCADLHYPVMICRPFIHLGAFLFGHFRLNSCSAKDAVKHARIPILLIHGQEDRLVPCAMSHEIARHCASPISVAIFPDAGHGLSYMVDPLRYEKEVSEFFKPIPGVGDKISDSFHKQVF